MKKKSIIEYINSIENSNQLINFISNSDIEIDFDKFSLLANENWEKGNNTKADFSPLIENLLIQQSKIKIEKINESDIDEVIKNTFEKFNYSINENCSIDFKSHLENFIKNNEL